MINNTSPKSVCLVTGGAGFIGCALSPLLADKFDRTVVLDNLHPQIHKNAERPAALDARVEFIRGDVTDSADWDMVLASVKPSTVIHLAAETGTGQSLTEANRHGSVNVVGTTQMLDAFTRHDALPARIVLTSSRAVYGEGLWVEQATGQSSYPGQRTRKQLEAGQWDFPGKRPTPFDAAVTEPRPTSVYGATKLAQEQILNAWCLSMGVTPIVLRLQNVYGPGQSLINPYTGIVSLFCRLAKSGKSIPVYEDGEIVRDFVYIRDVAEAIVAALDAPVRDVQAPYDIGSGEPASILRLAGIIAEHYGAPEPAINGAFRYGDVRHASCNIDRSMAALDWKPAILLQEGVEHLCEWIDDQI